MGRMGWLGRRAKAKVERAAGRREISSASVSLAFPSSKESNSHRSLHFLSRKDLEKESHMREEHANEPKSERGRRGIKKRQGLLLSTWRSRSPGRLARTGFPFRYER
jgi:hypothetical protein